MLNSISLDESNIKKVRHNIMVHYNLCYMYLLKEDWENAKPHFAALKLYAYTIENLVWTKSALRAQYDILISVLNAQIAMRDGELQKALDYIHELLPECKDKYGHIVNHFHLAILYGRLGDWKQQREHLVYVAQNGNMIHYARLARTLLEEHGNSEECLDFDWRKAPRG